MAVITSPNAPAIRIITPRAGNIFGESIRSERTANSPTRMPIATHALIIADTAGIAFETSPAVCNTKARITPKPEIVTIAAERLFILVLAIISTAFAININDAPSDTMAIAIDLKFLLSVPATS